MKQENGVRVYRLGRLKMTITAEPTRKTVRGIKFGGDDYHWSWNVTSRRFSATWQRNTHPDLIAA